LVVAFSILLLVLAVGWFALPPDRLQILENPACTIAAFGRCQQDLDSPRH
jgi:hypothetical protein